MDKVAQKFKSCRIARLPDHLMDEANLTAIEHNPANGPPHVRLTSGLVISPSSIAGKITYFWKPGTTMPVYFLDNPDTETRRLILEWANEWNKYGNLPYVETRSVSEAIVRILRDPRGGYYSYLGTMNLNVPRNENTMNLAGFTSRTPLSEYRRVVCHEFGHQRNYIHGQLRESIQKRLNAEKVIRRMMREQGWSREEVIAQVLDVEPEEGLTADAPDEELTSVMVYPFLASDTIDGQPIPGGDHITVRDGNFDRRMYGSGVIAKPVDPVVLMAGSSIDDSIGLQREVDWYPVKIDIDGMYMFRTEPAMVMGLYDSGRLKLMSPSVYGPNTDHTELTIRLAAGSYVLGVKHHFQKGTGPYRVSCVKV